MEEFPAVDNLERSIVSQGWIPTDTIIVWEHPKKKGHYIVVEGNTRTVVLRRVRERLAQARPPADPGRGTVEGAQLLHPVCDTVEAVERNGRRLLRCTVCHHDLGGYSENPKRAAAMRELALATINPHNGDCLQEYVLREYYCPSCASTLAADVAHRDEPMLDEVSLLAEGAEPTAAPAEHLEVVR